MPVNCGEGKRKAEGEWMDGWWMDGSVLEGVASLSLSVTVKPSKAER